MAIAFDSGADLGNNGGSGSISTTFTNTAGNIMFIGVEGDVVSGADDVLAPSYNGVTATLVQKQTANVGRFIYLYVLVSPTTGSNTITISSTSNHYLLAGAVTYSGAATAGQPDNSAIDSTSNSVTSFTTSLTTSADNCWTVLFSQNNGQSAAATAGTGLTRREFEGTFSTWALFDSGAAIHPAGSYSMTYNQGAAAQTGCIMASFSPGVAGGDSQDWLTSSIFRSHNISNVAY